MSAHAIEHRVLGAGTIANVADMAPEQQALLGFLTNRTPKTFAAYQLDLKTFWEWCASNDITPLYANKLQLQLYLEHLGTRGRAEATVARRFGTVLLFFKYAYDEELIATDPTRKLKRPKVDRAKQRRTWFTTLDMANVLREAYLRSPRDHALLFFMNVTALRVGEVCSLDVDSIHRDPGRAWIGFVGKGGGWYEQDLDYATLTALDKYLDGRTTGALFLNERGHRLRRANVQYTLDRYCAIAGIPYRVTPHALRRTYARTAIESGADIFGVSEHMRHSDTKTTQLYIGENTGRGKAAAAKVSTLMAQMSRVS